MGVVGKRRSRYLATNRPAGEPKETTRLGCHLERRLSSRSAKAFSISGWSKRAMSRETSSRSTCVPISLMRVVSKEVEWVVKGGALLPNELTTRTRGGRGGSAASARVVVQRRQTR